MHIRLIFRNRQPFKHRDTFKGHDPGDGCPGRKGLKFSREACLEDGEKSCAYIRLMPVPQTDTGRQEENSKANGRRVVKELGKLTP